MRRLALKTLPLAIALLAFFLRINAGPRIIDDAYITYRYSRNILAGNGFVFNPGERVLGTTTPLYTLLLVLLSLPFGGLNADFPLLSYSLNALLDSLSCGILYQLGKKLGCNTLGLSSALAFALAPFSVTFSIGGLETSLYVLLLLSTCYTYVNEWFEVAALLAALAFLTRPDALLLLLPLMLDFALNTWNALKASDNQPRVLGSFARTALTFALPSIAWLTFAHFYFGTFLPNSIAAKALAYHLPPNSALIRLLQHYATPFHEDRTFDKWGIGVGLFLYPSLALFGGIQLIRLTKRALGLALFPWLYFIAFAVANPLIFRWYLTPPIPFYFLCIFMGIITLWQRLSYSIRSKFPHFSQHLSHSLFLPTLAIPSLLVLPAWKLHPSHGPDRPAPEMAYIQLELHYEEAALFLRSHFKRPSSELWVAAGDVGVLGYLTGANILDTVGLNSPVTLRYLPLERESYVINYAVPTQLILDYLPDYVVILEVYGRKTLLQSRDFHERYHLLRTIDTDIYGSNGLMIFAKSSP
ncbi:MAG: hypothetical protein RML93_01560 [Anaerolineales bacterium]|nr:hypothetical protein [Anaerolineales bacterium]MDW8445959.1 hypothetical protein [Anaerolineales bacterium]